MERQKPRAKDRPEPFEINGTVVKAGSTEHVEIPVARLATGTWLPLPIAIIHGRRPGPTVWLSAAVHGDELNGIPIIQEVIRRLVPKAMAGTVLAVPVVNVFGFINESRYLPDRRDLNRSFPGSPRGSLAAQVAHLFMEQIVGRCSFGIDFHSGSDGRTNLPQIRCDADDPEIRRLAVAFAAPVMLHAKERPGSLRAEAAKLGIRSLLYEAGEDRRFDTSCIQVGVSGVIRVLQALEMIDEDTAEPAAPSFFSRRTQWVRSRRGGMCRIKVSLGEQVERGQTVAFVSGTLARTGAAIRAPSAGLVIGHLNRALVNRGDAIAHIAEPASPQE